MGGGKQLQRLSENALPLALLVQACLLFYRLDLLPIWGDEQFTLDVIRKPWAEIPGVLQADIHPPIYYFLAKLWLGIPWPGEMVAHVRSLSAVFCLLATVLIYRLWLSDVSRATRCWFLALWALSPALLMYSRMARSYSLQLLVGTAAFFAAAQFLEAPADRRRLAAYVALVSALLYTHYLPGLAVTGATSLFLLASFYKKRDSRVLRALAFSSLGIVLLYGPWVSTLVSAVKRVPGADPYVLVANPWIETLVKLVYLLTSLSFGEAFPAWSIVVGAIVAPGVSWLLWNGVQKGPAWLPHSLTVAFIAYLGAAAWVSFPFVGARLLFLLPLYLLWVLAGRAEQPRFGSWICCGMLLVALGSLSSYYTKSDFLNQGYLVPFGEIAASIENRSSGEKAILLVDGYNTDPAPLLATMRGKFPVVRIRDAASRDAAREAVASGGWPKIWVLRNAHDISPGREFTALEAAADERYESERLLFVPFSPMDRLVARWLGRSASSHHYQMIEFTRRNKTR